MRSSRALAVVVAVVAACVLWSPGGVRAHEEDPPGGPTPSAAALSNVPCVSGMADVFPCSNVDLLAFVTLAEFGSAGANDIWGWTDPQSGVEYALLGLDDGVAFVELADPTQPVYLGKLPTHTASSGWRDVRVHAGHALVVSEAAGHGMQVFDLSQLAGVVAPPVTFAATAHYAGFADAHNIAVNDATATAIAVGTSTCSGGLHFIDVSNPLLPVFTGCYSGDGYTHDVQCVLYHGLDTAHLGREICFASNTDTLTIVDITDRMNPVQLSRTGYAGVGYTHQGWLTADHEYFLLDDEADENQQGHPTRTYVWDVADLGAPVLTGFHGATTAAVDHNQYVLGNHVFQANYRAGMRVLRLGNLSIAELAEVAFFDVIPADDATGFQGAWSVYPYFMSGTVVVSSTVGGLFVLAPDLAAIPQCDDGIDNDSDGKVDWNGGPGGEPADPNCLGDPARNREVRPGCGLGFEVAALLALLPGAGRFGGGGGGGGGVRRRRRR